MKSIICPNCGKRVLCDCPICKKKWKEANHFKDGAQAQKECSACGHKLKKDEWLQIAIEQFFREEHIIP